MKRIIFALALSLTAMTFAQNNSAMATDFTIECRSNLAELTQEAPLDAYYHAFKQFIDTCLSEDIESIVITPVFNVPAHDYPYLSSSVDCRSALRGLRARDYRATNDEIFLCFVPEAGVYALRDIERMACFNNNSCEATDYVEANRFLGGNPTAEVVLEFCQAQGEESIIPASDGAQCQPSSSDNDGLLPFYYQYNLADSSLIAILRKSVRTGQKLHLNNFLCIDKTEVDCQRIYGN